MPLSGCNGGGGSDADDDLVRVAFADFGVYTIPARRLSATASDIASAISRVCMADDGAGSFGTAPHPHAELDEQLSRLRCGDRLRADLPVLWRNEWRRSSAARGRVWCGCISKRPTPPRWMRVCRRGWCGG